MAAGDHAHLQVFGQAATSGLKEMFPQTDLKVVPQKGGTVDVIGGEDVQAKAIGEDTIDVAWRDNLKIAVPVKVAANTITDLQISPARKNDQHRPGGHVCSIRHAGRQPRGPHADGRRAVECHRSRGRERGLRHDGRRHRPRTNQGDRRVRRTKGRGHPERHPRRGRGSASIVRRRRHHDGGVYRRSMAAGVVIGDGTVVGGIQPAGKVVGLVFEPPFYRSGVQAMPQTAKLLRQYENGGFDDVSNDPNVKVTDPKVGGRQDREGRRRLEGIAGRARHDQDDRHARRPDRRHGDRNQRRRDAGTAIAGQLVVNPTTLSLWSGETQADHQATIDPGGGQAPVPVEVTVKAPEGQGIVSVEGNKVTGRSVGECP